MGIWDYLRGPTIVGHKFDIGENEGNDHSEEIRSDLLIDQIRQLEKLLRDKGNKIVINVPLGKCSTQQLNELYNMLNEKLKEIEKSDNYGLNTNLQGDIGRESPAEAFRHSKRILHDGGDKTERKAVEEGKDYVMTDIHSHYSVFKEMLKKLGPKDRLWILGDILDSHGGEVGKAMDILRDIVKINKEEGPQIEVLLGNHDVGIIRLYEDIKKGGITLEEMRVYVTDLYFRLHQDNFSPEQKRITQKVRGILGKRVSYNYGTTWDDIRAFFQLSSEEQEDIYQLLKNAPYFVTIQRGVKKIALVHALPPNIEPKIGMRITDRYIEALPVSEDEKIDLRKWMTWGYKSGTDDYIKIQLPDCDWNEFIESVESNVEREILEDIEKKKLKKKMILEQMQRRQVLDKWAASGYTVLRGHYSQERRISNGNLNLGGKLNSIFSLYCIQDGCVEYFRHVEKEDGIEVYTSNRLDALIRYEHER